MFGQQAFHRNNRIDFYRFDNFYQRQSILRQLVTQLTDLRLQLLVSGKQGLTGFAVDILLLFLWP